MLEQVFESALRQTSGANALTKYVQYLLCEKTLLLLSMAGLRASRHSQPFAITTYHPPLVFSPLTAPLCLAIFLPRPT